MSILDKIVEHKRVEVATLKEVFPIAYLEKSIYYNTEPISLKKYIKREDLHGIIAEYKRMSPSQGHINRFAQVEQVSIGYMQAGACALSILTDKEFFGGNSDDLKTARKFNYCPILRKEFIIDEYQVFEAKSIGADAILLIAAILDDDRMRKLSKRARELGLEVLIESHDENELRRSLEIEPDLIGINNRNLKDFNVDINTSLELLKLIPPEAVKISESGLREPKVVKELRDAGYNGFLIGQQFMETHRPEDACNRFIETLKGL